MRKNTLKLCLMTFTALVSYYNAQEVLLTKVQPPIDLFNQETQSNDYIQETQEIFTNDEIERVEKITNQDLHFFNARRLAAADIAKGKTATWNVGNNSVVGKAISAADAKSATGDVFFCNGSPFLAQSLGKKSAKTDFDQPLNTLRLQPAGSKNQFYLLEVAPQGTYDAKVTKCYKTLCFLAYQDKSTALIINIQAQPYLVNLLTAKDAFGSNSTVIWDGGVAYNFLDFAYDASYAGSTSDLADPRICVGNSPCYTQIAPSASQDPATAIQVGPIWWGGTLDTTIKQIINLSGQTVLATELGLENSWYSNDTVIWLGLSSYHLDYILFPNNTYNTLNPDITQVGICFGYTDCVGNLTKVKGGDPTDPALKCFGNTCFSFEATQRTEDIVQVDDQTMLVSSLDHATAWQATTYVIWNGYSPYSAIVAIPNNQFVTVQADPNGLRICAGVGMQNCTLNPTHTASDAVTDASQCLTQDKLNCYDGPQDVATYGIYQIETATAFTQQLLLADAWFSNDTIIWNSQFDGWKILQVLPDSNNFSTIVANLSDPQFEIQTGVYTTQYLNLVLVADAKEGDEGIVWCLGSACFSGDTDSNHYDVIQVGDLYFEVTNITVADAWTNNATIIWVGYTPFIYAQQFPNQGFQTFQADQTTFELCFGGVCYLNLQAVDMTNPDVATTSVGCLDENQTLCFSGEVDEKTYQIALIDGFALPIVQLSFDQAWKQNINVLWDSSFNAWSPQGIFPDNSYSTLELDITTIIECQDGVCYNGLAQVDPTDADATAAALFCWQATCYSASELELTQQQLCVADGENNYCALVDPVDSDTATAAPESYIVGDQAYVPLVAIPNNVTPDLTTQLSDLTICLTDGICLTSSTVTEEGAEAGEGQQVYCSATLGVCLLGQASAYVAPEPVDDYVPVEPVPMPSILECGAFCEETEIILCIDADCINVMQHSFDTAWNDDATTEYIWTGLNSFSYISLADSAGDSSVNLTLADIVVARVGVASGARFDDNSIQLLAGGANPEDPDVYCFEALCYTFQAYAYPIEDIISFDDAQISALVQEVSSHTAWRQQGLVIYDFATGSWVSPFRYTGWVPTTTNPTYNYNLADIRYCDAPGSCYVQAALTTSDDTSAVCYDNQCFVATPDTTDYEVASFGSYTPLVIQMSYQDAYYSGQVTYFDGTASDNPTGWTILFDVPAHDFNDVTIDLTTVIMCVGDGVSECYTSLTETTEDATPDEGFTLYFIPELGQWVQGTLIEFPFAAPSPQNQECPDAYVPVNVTLCIDENCFNALNESFSTAWNDDGTTAYTWVGLQPYVLYESTSGDENSVYITISDPIVCQPGSAETRFDSTCVTLIDVNFDAIENSGDGSITCIDIVCYNSQAYSGPSEYVIAFNDFGIKGLFNQLAVADAWYSSDNIVWSGLTPYLFVGQVPYLTIQNVDLNLFDCSICYGSTACYLNILPFDPNYPPVDGQASLSLGDQSFIADLDDTTYDIVAIDNLCILVQNLQFDDAWVSINEIIWVGGVGYRALDVIPDTSFSTLSWTLQDLIICVPGGKVCVQNVRKLNPRETPKKSTYVIKFGLNVYNSDVYNKGFLMPPPEREDVLCAEQQGDGTGTKLTKISTIVPSKHVVTSHQQIDKPQITKKVEVVKKVPKTKAVVSTIVSKKVKLEEKSKVVQLPSSKKVQAKKPVALKSGIINLMATSLDNSTSMTKTDLIAEKMRMTFRDYFMYAISGKTSDPVQAGQCSIQCLSLPTYCCVNINSLDKSTGLSSFDNLCMNKQVVSAQTSIMLDSINYSLKCSENSQAVSGAFFIKSTMLVFVSAIGLIVSL